MSDFRPTPDQTIHYLDPNPGGSPGVLLLHGLGASGASWQLQFPALQEAGCRPLAPDMRGFGRSSFPGRLSIELMADDCYALVTHLGLARVHVAGISMGGVIAQQLALSHPDIVTSLVLVNTFHHLRPKSPLHWAYYAFRFLLLQTRGLPAQAHAVSQRIFPQPAQTEMRRLLEAEVAMADPSAYRAAMLALARFNSASKLRRLSVPTLVVTGECDTTVAPALQARLARSIPGAEHVIIPGAGHAVTVTHPDEFNRHLLKFIAMHTPGPQSPPHSIGSDRRYPAKSGMVR